MSSAKQKELSKNPFRYYSICSWIDPEDTRKIPQELCDLKGLMKLLQKKKTKGPVIATYNLIMKSEVKEAPSEVELSCSTVPDTVSALKEEIEEQYNIPVAMQSIKFHGELLEDGDSKLKRIGFRNRDTLEVSYGCEAEIQKVKRVLTWVDYVTAYLHNQHPLISTELNTEAELLVMVGLNERLFERMANNYFSPPDNPRVKANKCYFLSKDGVAKLVNLLHIITDQPWGEQVIHLKLLESRLLDALRCFGTGDEKYVEELIKHDVPGFVVMMMTRFRLVVFRPVEDLMGSPGVKAHNDVLLLEVISSVLEIMWTMRLKKEQFTDMTSLHVCVENLVALTVSPSVTNRQACLALYIVLIRLCWIESIVDLGQASIVFLDAPEIREGFGESPDEVMMVKYFCSVYVSWKLLHNCTHFKTPGAGVKTQIEKTFKRLKDFHATVDREKLKVMVDKYDLAMYVLLPMLGLMLHPKSQPHTMLPDYPTEFINELTIMAFKCLLIHMEVVFTNDKVREGIKLKEIGEFLVCFAWGLPPSLRPYAQHLVNYVHSYKPLPMPKLSILVRSRVARRYLEFDKLQKEKEGAGVLDQVAHPQIARVGLPLMTKDQHLYVIAIQ